MNVNAVASASRHALVRYTVAAACNAHDLVEDAEVLLAAGRHARAYSLAALAVEEFGKACGGLALVVIPDEMRTQAPIRDLLEKHLLKQMGGILMGALGASTPGLTARVAEASQAQIAELLSQAAELASEADQAKKRGFYVDLAEGERIQQPSEITEAEAGNAVARARAVAEAASMLSDPEAQAIFASPPPGLLEISARLFTVYLEAGVVESPQTAAAVIAEMVSKTPASLRHGHADRRPAD
jgi:AbiV family abortive infection protein